MLLLGWVPYIVGAVVYAALFDQSVSGFFKAVGFLTVARLVVALIEWPATAVQWKLEGRPKLVRLLTEFLCANKFPAPKPGRKSYYTYLGDVEFDPKSSLELRNAAISGQALYGALEQHGIVYRFRLSSASDEALSQYRMLLDLGSAHFGKPNPSAVTDKTQDS